jgi:hypothetical protein
VSPVKQWLRGCPYVQRLIGDQAEHQILGIIRSLAYTGQAQPQHKKQADRDPREQKKKTLTFPECSQVQNCRIHAKAKTQVLAQEFQCAILTKRSSTDIVEESIGIG